MGEVFHARDARLNREAAIKILPAALAQDPERMARFEREAKALAALNHPNIAQIYGMEAHALVMEFAPGDSPRGPMPVDEVLNIAQQPAVALEATRTSAEIAAEREAVLREFRLPACIQRIRNRFPGLLPSCRHSGSNLR